MGYWSPCGWKCDTCKFMAVATSNSEYWKGRREHDSLGHRTRKCEREKKYKLMLFERVKSILTPLVDMVVCYFCGNDIRKMKEEFFKNDDSIKIDRYFKDKRDGKIMCKVCGIHYIKEEYFRTLANPEESKLDDFADFTLNNFERILL